MPSRDPLLRPALPRGRPADRLAAGLAALGLVGSTLATLWFFLGFFETDPAWAPASSAFLLSLGLGAFAIIPCAVTMRLCWTAWRHGFQPAHALWTLFLMAPWIGLAVVAGRSDWLPLWLSAGPLLIAIPLCLWASVSLWLERVNPPTDKG
ncbi:hypothetical protein ACFFUB_00820 [Algimonas porphyrae]|uniref:DUF805 domain-containing protein n=1 Tax=Algimonas porphyrae TaxID=1128113 RepID=A0ABQ5UZ82_9PROT|nr:hypothetical protein [Algimonas porphyrae]GLQ20576.1 hypothetical protein GCM10007854_15310 [Algimonas porphyrae]